VQAVVGTVAGIISIAGALFSVAQFIRPNKTGELVTVVQDAGTRRAVIDAAVEVLTTDNALVATLAPDTSGRAMQPLPAGAYIVRVSHPRYASEARHIQVLPHQTVEVRATLRAGSSAPSERTVSNGWRAFRRALHF
jgi:Carboxypeptidase regulatory-like domain